MSDARDKAELRAHIATVVLKGLLDWVPSLSQPDQDAIRDLCLEANLDDMAECRFYRDKETGQVMVVMVLFPPLRARGP